MALKSNLNKADVNKLGYIGAVPIVNSQSPRDSDAWFTPKRYIELTKQVIGDVDLDPFSCAQANEVVGATRYFDENDDALAQQWFKTPGTVFMNPPYGRQLIHPSVACFIKHWRAKDITEAVVLVNNATETKWFQGLLEECSALCLVRKRIAFENQDGKHVSGNTRGQVFLYYGKRVARFKKVFTTIGTVVKRA